MGIGFMAVGEGLPAFFSLLITLYYLIIMLSLLDYWVDHIQQLLKGKQLRVKLSRLRLRNKLHLSCLGS
jgi:hypothetical protein